MSHRKARIRFHFFALPPGLLPVTRWLFSGAATAVLLLGLGPLAHAENDALAATQVPDPAMAVAVSNDVDINSASAAQLAKVLVGVGQSRAEAIVRYREQFGPFESVDELTEVKGIGLATVERNRAQIRLK